MPRAVRGAAGGQSHTRCSASTIARAVPALLDLLKGEGQLTRAFAARGLGQLKDPRAAAPLLAIAENAGEPTAVRIQAVRGVALMGDANAAAAMRRLIVLAEGRL